MEIKNVHQTCNKDRGKQGEQLLKSGGHCASLDKTNKNLYVSMIPTDKTTIFPSSTTFM